MPGKREAAARVFTATGAARVLGGLRSAALRDLRVLAYHRVLPSLDEARFAGDLELVSAVEGEFAWQMAYLARHFHPVTCVEVAAALREGAPLPRRAVMVTFDDGFRDNHDVALPVLRHHGVPAVFFVATGAIGSGRMFWFDRIVHLLLRTRAPALHAAGLGTVAVPEGDAARRAVAMDILRRLKRVPDAERLRTLDEFEAAAAVHSTPAELDAGLAMSWDQVRALADGGMEIGSHTVSHPILAMTEPDALAAELGASKATIERETGRPVAALAYPVGGASAVNAAVRAATEGAGYRIAFTYQPGVNRIGHTDPLLLRRIHVERYTSRTMFEAALQWPEVFAR